MLGLDPSIHARLAKLERWRMDHRVEPDDDGARIPPTVSSRARRSTAVMRR